jgi:hypothetical protein
MVLLDWPQQDHLWLGPKIAAIPATSRLSNTIPAEILTQGPSCVSHTAQLKRK